MLSLPALTTKKSALTTSETALADALDPPMGALAPRGRASRSPEQEQPKREQEQKPEQNWLTAQAKAIATARPKKPASAYKRKWR